MKKKPTRVPKPKKDRTRNDKGILLEQIVAKLHKAEGVKVETNVFLTPKSGDKSREREIDVLLTSEVAGYTVQVAIQCKNYGKPITIGQIGEFKDLLDDVGIPYQYGIIVSVHGYQKGAISRANELGIKTLVLEGLDETRLKTEIQDTFQFFVYLLLVVEEMHVITEIADGYMGLSFWDEDKNITGFFTDLIVSRWRNGEIPTKLGEYPLDLKLPPRWHQILDGKVIYPSVLSAKVRVVAYLAEMKGKAEELKLKEAQTDKIEKFHLHANFDVLHNLIKSSHEEPIFTEEELKTLKKDAKTSIENRIRLPKIFVRNHLEPISKRAFNNLMRGTDNLTLDEIEKLPQPKFEEVEGNTFGSMQEKALLGEPVIIPTDSGDLVDARMLMKEGKFDEVTELFPYLDKFPRTDFAEYLSIASLSQGETLFKKSLSEEPGVKKALETQAFNLFGRAIEISPNPVDTHISLGVIFGDNGLYEKSVDCFNWVISAEPQNPMARYNLAETFLRMGKPVEALDTLSKAIEEVKEGQPELHRLRAKILGSEGKYKEATVDLVTVWAKDYKLIVENRDIHQVVLDVFNNFTVIGTGIILADIYLYYVRKLAKENLLDSSKSYLDRAITILEDIYRTIEDSSNDKFYEASFKPVLSRAEHLVSEVVAIYPTSSWKSRLESLDHTSAL
jgi:tetratricopeptide (TPR) repeat protein